MQETSIGKLDFASGKRQAPKRKRPVETCWEMLCLVWRFTRKFEDYMFVNKDIAYIYIRICICIMYMYIKCIYIYINYIYYMYIMHQVFPSSFLELSFLLNPYQNINLVTCTYCGNQYLHCVNLIPIFLSSWGQQSHRTVCQNFGANFRW